MGERGAYIYQRLRTRGVEPLYPTYIIRSIEALAEQIFHRQITLNIDEVRSKIAAAITRERLSQHAIHAVELRLYPSGEIEAVTESAFYLEAFPLRAIRPVATPYRITSDLLLAPTSARDALLDICKSESALPSESISMWIDHNNEITAIDGASVVAVTQDEVIFSQLGKGVEFELALRAIEKTSHRVVRGEILYNNAHDYKELLYIDHRGVVALDSIEGRQLSNIVAERIVQEVKKLEKL